MFECCLVELRVTDSSQREGLCRLSLKSSVIGVCLDGILAEVQVGQRNAVPSSCFLSGAGGVT